MIGFKFYYFHIVTILPKCIYILSTKGRTLGRTNGRTLLNLILNEQLGPRIKNLGDIFPLLQTVVLDYLSTELNLSVISLNYFDTTDSELPGEQ